MPSNLQSIASSVIGAIYTSDTERVAGQPRTHVITAPEFRPFVLEWINEHGENSEPDIVECFEKAADEMQEPTDEEGMVKTWDWDELFYHVSIDPAVSPWFYARLSEHLHPHADELDLQRGDIVRYQFFAYRCNGVNFWDGDKVVPQNYTYDGEADDTDYGVQPRDFLTLTEFPVDYFHNEVQVTGYWLDTALFADQVLNAEPECENDVDGIYVTYQGGTHFLPKPDVDGPEEMEEYLESVRERIEEAAENGDAAFWF